MGVAAGPGAQVAGTVAEGAAAVVAGNGGNDGFRGGGDASLGTLLQLQIIGVVGVAGADALVVAMRVSAVLGHTVSRRSAVPQLTAARPVWKAAPLLLLVAHVADASSLLVAAGKEAQTFLAVTAAATLPPGRRPATRALFQTQIIGEVGVADAAAPVAVREGAKLSLAISHLAAGGLLTELRAAVPSLFVAHLADAPSLGVAGGVWAQVQAALLVRAAGVKVLTGGGGGCFLDALFWG